MNDLDKKIIMLDKIISSAKKIVLFSGAGISVASGIPDFRSSNGLYNQKTSLNIPPEEIISHDFFIERTKDFYDFYKSKMVFTEAKPNIIHDFFAKLESDGKLMGVITQNIDGLHEKSGSKNVVNLHGTIYKNHCTECGKFYDLNYIMESNGVPHCDSCGGIIKPDVVLYGEPLDYLVTDKALKMIDEADVLIIIGTSLVVQPAASLVRYFSGQKIVLINKDATPYDLQADLVINALAEDVIYQLLNIKNAQ